jgi:hypothetical protein
MEQRHRLRTTDPAVPHATFDTFALESIELPNRYLPHATLAFAGLARPDPSSPYPPSQKLGASHKLLGRLIHG